MLARAAGSAFYVENSRPERLCVPQPISSTGIVFITVQNCIATLYEHTRVAI